MQRQLQPLPHLQPAADPALKQLLGVDCQWVNIKTADSCQQAAPCPPLMKQATQCKLLVREAKETRATESPAAGEKEGEEMLEAIRGVTGLLNSNQSVVAIGGAEEARCGSLQFFKPVAILLHQLESEQQGGEGFEGGVGQVSWWRPRGRKVKQKLVTIRKHQDGHSQVSRHPPKYCNRSPLPL